VSFENRISTFITGEFEMSHLQITFFIIFPLAITVIAAGWTAAMVAFIRRSRRGKYPEGKRMRRFYIPRRRVSHTRDAWELMRDSLRQTSRLQLPPQS
jgi:hypothetical protein